MLIKMVLVIVFSIFAVYNKMYVSMGLWDLVSFFVVIAGSAAVWIPHFVSMI